MAQSFSRLQPWIFVLFALGLGGCTTRPPVSDYLRPASYAALPSPASELGAALASAVQSHPGESGFALLSSGTDAFVTRIALIDQAQHSIDLQYFSTEDDTTGRLLLAALLRAADRGVHVRMLLDDWNLNDYLIGMTVLDTHPNIDVRVFNPYSTRDQSIFAYVGNAFTRFDQITRRMHNKALIADNEVAIMGGRNLGDEYFNASENINFRDMDVLAAGPIAGDISKSFDDYWNSAESYPVGALNLPDSDGQQVAQLRAELRQSWSDFVSSPPGRRLQGLSLAAELLSGSLPLIWAKADLIADSPDKIEHAIQSSESKPKTELDRLANNARREFIIVTPYLVPLDSGVQWLLSQVRRGVAVRIVTDSLASTDTLPAEAGYSNYRETLVQGGVELYELKSERAHPLLRSLFRGTSQYGLHAKLYVFDRRDVVIGSFNYDPRSIYLNTEQVLVIHSPELSDQIVDMFDETIAPGSSYHVMMRDGPDSGLVWVTREQGKDVRYYSDPRAGLWRNIMSGFLSLLPIDGEL